MNTINITSTSLTEIIASFHNDFCEYGWPEAAIDTLKNFFVDNYKTISLKALKEICCHTYHFNKAKDVCSIVALMNGKYVKGFTLRDALSEKNKTHIILPCYNKQNKRCGYLIINREAFGQKSKNEFKLPYAA